MSESAFGALHLQAVPEERIEEVIACLCKYYKGANKEKLAALIAKSPLTLGQNVPAGVAQKVLAELAGLGAKGEFTPHRVAAEEETAKESMRTGERPEAKATAGTEPTDLRKTVLTAFRQETIRYPLPLSYRFGLAVVALAMLLLPLLYVAMISGLGYLVYWHATANLSFFHGIRNAKAALFAYAAPLIIGVLLVFFMIKPIFARRSAAVQRIEILPQAEPLLTVFIQRICQTVGAPMPTRIRFDDQVNASASLRRGFSSFFGHDLVLTIGMPLAGGLSLSEFAGVLAHEFGHFAQASGMRLTYVIRSVNGWFYRVVNEEDVWDVRLRNWSKDLDFRIAIVFKLARLFIWLTRKVLWLLMQLGQAISCFMSRQMEFDADRFEAGLVGAEVFTSTSNKLEYLSVAHSWAFDDIDETWKEGKLPNNMSMLVSLKVSQMDESTRRKILQRELSRKTQKLDTHPSTADRIAAAAEVSQEPIFLWHSTDVPVASVLFRNFEELSHRTTMEYYSLVLGETPARKNLIDVSDMVQSHATEQEFSSAVESYSFGNFTPWRPFGPSGDLPGAPPNPKAALARLNDLRQEIGQRKTHHSEALKNWLNLKKRLIVSSQARALLEAGFQIDAKQFYLPKATIEGVEVAECRFSESEAQITKALEEVEALQRERLILGLQLLQVPAVTARIAGAEAWLEEMSRHWQALATLQEQLSLLWQLNLQHAQLEALARQLKKNSDDRQLDEVIQEKIEALRSSFSELEMRLGNCDYPFDHARNDVTLAKFLVPFIPEPGDLGSCLRIGDETVQRTNDLASRLAGRLCCRAETVEKAFSLPPV